MPWDLERDNNDQWTFGKAFGSGGAFLATNKTFGEHLLQTSGAFRYTTALAPPLASAALEALNLLKENPKGGRNLQKDTDASNSEVKSLLKLIINKWEEKEQQKNGFGFR